MNDEGKRLAGFVQRTPLWRESQVVLLEIEVDVEEEPRADPWNSYDAARFAWSPARPDSGAGYKPNATPTRAPCDFLAVEPA